MENLIILGFFILLIFCLFSIIFFKFLKSSHNSGFSDGDGLL